MKSRSNINYIVPLRFPGIPDITRSSFQFEGNIYTPLSFSKNKDLYPKDTPERLKGLPYQALDEQQGQFVAMINDDQTRLVELYIYYYRENGFCYLVLDAMRDHQKSSIILPNGGYYQ